MTGWMIYTCTRSPTAAAAVAAAAPPVLGTSTVTTATALSDPTTASTRQGQGEEEDDNQRAPPSPLDPLLENVAVATTAATVQDRPSPSLDSRLLEEGTAEHHRSRQEGVEGARGQQHHHHHHHHHHDGAHQGTAGVGV